MTTAALPDGLAFHFRHFIRGLCDVVAHYIERDGGAAALIVAIINRLGRRETRFMAILARFKAGLPRAPHRERAARVRSDGPRPLAPDRVSRCRVHLSHMMRHEAVVYSRILEILLADPEMAALLAASPDAGRLLRPLWRMLSSRPLPQVLRPPPHPPALSAAPAAPIGRAQGAERQTPVESSPVRRVRLHVGRSGFGPPIPP